MRLLVQVAPLKSSSILRLGDMTQLHLLIDCFYHIQLTYKTCFHWLNQNQIQRYILRYLRHKTRLEMCLYQTGFPANFRFHQIVCCKKHVSLSGTGH